jgi:transposase
LDYLLNGGKDERNNVPNRRYTEEFRVEAARLVVSVGHNKAARRLGVPVATIGNWARLQLKQNAVPRAEVAAPVLRTKPAVSELEAENSRLRKKLASAKLDKKYCHKRRHTSRRGRGEVCMDRR